MSNTMIFTMTSELKDVLNLMIKTASQIKGDTYPDAVLIDGKTLTATNDSVAVRYTLSQEETGLMPQTFESPVLMPIKGIRAFADTPIDTEMTVTQENRVITITKGKKKGKITLAGMDNTKYPDFKDMDFTNVDEISVKNFTENVKSIRHSVSDNKSKRIYTGVHFVADGENLSILAINGFTASICKENYKSEVFSLSVSNQCIDTVLQAISIKDGTETIKIIPSNDMRHAVFVIGNGFTIRTRLLEGSIMDVSTFFKKGENTLTFEKSELINILKSIQNTANNNNVFTVAMTIHQNEIDVEYKGNISSLTDSFNVSSKVTLPEQKIGVNMISLLNTLEAIPSDVVEMSYVNSSNPIMLSYHGIDDEKYNKHIIVPVRLPN